MAIRPALILEDGFKKQMRSGDLLPVANIPEMGAASAGAGGTAGAVPPSAAGDQDKVLTAGKSWVNLPPGGGSVTSVSVATANGFAGTVATPTTTPVITLSTPISGILQGDGTAISAVDANQFYIDPSTGAVGINTNSPTGLMTIKGAIYGSVVSIPPGVATCNPGAYAGYPPQNAFTGGRWVVTVEVCWLKIDLGAGNAKRVLEYSVQHPSESTALSPSAWTFEGSNDDTNWTVLDTRSGITDWASYVNIERKWPSTAAINYRYYRFNITASPSAWTNIHNAKLYGNFGTDIKITPTGMGFGMAPEYLLDLAADSARKPGTGGLWTVNSDAVLKTNIETANLQTCWDFVESLPLNYFAWKEDCYTVEQVSDRHALGWIAQDMLVDNKLPKAVRSGTFIKPPVLIGTEEVQEAVFEEVAVEETYIELVEGVATQKSWIIYTKQPILAVLGVVDENGDPVLDANGEQVTYKTPQTQTVTRPVYTQETIENCLSLDASQIYAHLYGAFQLAQQKIRALETEYAALLARVDAANIP